MTRDQARKVLDVSIRATSEEIRVAYRAKLMTAHPDQGGTDEMLRLVLEAFKTLDESSQAQTASSGGASSSRRGPAPQERIEITPSIAMVGGRVATRLSDGRRISVNLPAGLRQGSKIKVKDAVLGVHIKGRKELFVSGDDLCMMVRVNPQVLLDGGRVSVKTPKGVRTVWVTKPVGNNNIVRIAGQGLPATSKHKQGNLILKLVPSRLSKNSKLAAKLKKFTGDWATA